MGFCNVVWNVILYLQSHGLMVLVVETVIASVQENVVIISIVGTVMIM